MSRSSGGPIERESKLEVSPGDWNRVFDAADHVRTDRQINIYYGDAGGAASSALLRVRLIPGRTPIVTVKESMRRTSGYRESREHEAGFGSAVRGSSRPVWIDVERDLPAGHADCLLARGVTRLRRLGSMRNTRHIVRLEGFEFELDRTVLPSGEIVHEIEFESDDVSRHEAATAVIRRLAASARPCDTTKSRRFVHALKR